MAAATYFYYETVHRMMPTAVAYLLKVIQIKRISDIVKFPHFFPKSLLIIAIFYPSVKIGKFIRWK